jgi:hypothetical protein
MASIVNGMGGGNGGGSGGGATFTVSANPAAATDNTIVAAQAFHQAIRIWSLSLVASGGANTFILKSGSTTLIAATDLAADGQYNPVPGSGKPLFTGGYGEAIVINLSAATPVATTMTIEILDANLQALHMQR